MSFLHLDWLPYFGRTYLDHPLSCNLEAKFEEPSSNFGSTFGPIVGKQTRGPFCSQSPQWYLWILSGFRIRLQRIWAKDHWIMLLYVSQVCIASRWLQSQRPKSSASGPNGSKGKSRSLDYVYLSCIWTDCHTLVLPTLITHCRGIWNQSLRSPLQTSVPH